METETKEVTTTDKKSNPETDQQEDERHLIWNELKVVPDHAKKQITGGRLKGMTDIKPQWRLEKLTEVFGMIGFGWKYEITKQWIESTEINQGEKCAFININLFVKVDDVWSEPIFGTGGNSFVTKEKHGMYLSDEAYKMALTDAISVASKQLGLASDVYMGYSDSKYPNKETNNNQTESNNQSFNDDKNKNWLNETPENSNEPTREWLNVCKGIKEGKVTSIKDVRDKYKVNKKEAAKLEELINKNKNEKN